MHRHTARTARTARIARRADAPAALLVCTMMIAACGARSEGPVAWVAAGGQFDQPGRGGERTISAGSSDTAQNGPSSGSAQFPIAPMRLVPTPDARGRDARMDLELRADGSIYSQGRPMGRIVGSRALGANGREVISVARDGTVVIAGERAPARMINGAEVVFANGNRLTLDAQGRPVLVRRGSSPDAAPARFVGLRPDTRPTALLLTLFIAAMDGPDESEAGANDGD